VQKYICIEDIKKFFFHNSRSYFYYHKMTPSQCLKISSPIALILLVVTGKNPISIKKMSWV